MSLKKKVNETYIIAEIGQNHNGDITIAKKIIDQLDRFPYDEHTGDRWSKVNAIKLTKRDLSEELCKEQMERIYDTPNSFGVTYGKHREFLELTYEQHVELGEYIKAKGFDFVQTLCSVKTVKLLDMVKVDRIKIASRDLTNIPLLETLASRSEPVILSTGMADEEDLKLALSILTKNGKSNIEILHCLSQYPAEYSKLNLKTIDWLKRKYNKLTIGYSDHSIGSHIPVAAVAMGAEIIEKHVTLDTAMKGSDHKGSANIEDFIKMVHDIRAVEHSLGENEMHRSKSVEVAKEKLERSLAWSCNVSKGEMISEDMFCMLSPGNGMKWADRLKYIGKENKLDREKYTLV